MIKTIHMQNDVNIFVFRTNINTHLDKQVVKELLGNNEGIMEWSVDLQDCDRVLRVVTPTKTAEDIIELITGTGYECHELE